MGKKKKWKRKVTPKILAIDKNKENLTTVSVLLKSTIPDCTIITAQSRAEALKKTKAELPDAILLDIKMVGKFVSVYSK